MLPIRRFDQNKVMTKEKPANPEEEEEDEEEEEGVRGFLQTQVG